jgi:hypothetical protein
VVLHVSPQFIKRIPDPHESRRWFYTGTIPALEAVKLLRGNANPRLGDLKGKVAEEIRATIHNDPREFHLRNRGLIVSTTEATFDTDLKTLTLENPKTENPNVLWGLLDGGHTYDVLREECGAAAGNDADGSLATLKDTWVDVKIRVGLTRDEIIPAAAGNNTSTQLRPWTLANYKGELAPIHDMVTKTMPDLAKDIAFKENETNEETGEERWWDVLDVLQRMTLLNTYLYPGYETSKHPVVAYSSKSKVLDDYLRNPETYKGMSKIAASVFRLPAIVESKLSHLPKVNGNLAFATRVKAGDLNHALLGQPKFTRKYRISDAVLFPMVAALRPLIEGESGKPVEWAVDPVEFLDNNIEALYQTFLNFYQDEVDDKTNKRSLSGMGKDGRLWQTLHAKVLAILAKPKKK